MVGEWRLSLAYISSSLRIELRFYNSLDLSFHSSLRYSEVCVVSREVLFRKPITVCPMMFIYSKLNLMRFHKDNNVDGHREIDNLQHSFVSSVFLIFSTLFLKWFFSLFDMN